MKTLDSTEASPALVRQRYIEDGIVVIRSAIDGGLIEEVCDALSAVIGARLKSLGRPVESNGDLDACFASLTAIDQLHGMEIIRVARDLPEFYRFMSDRELLRLVAACLDTAHFQSVHDIAQLRIDPPDYHVRDFGWHQDYPYNVTSLDAVTAWIPLRPVTEEMGLLQVVPKSHRELRAVIYDTGSHRSGAGTGHSLFRIDADPSQFDEDSVVLADVAPGDLVLFHTLLVHRSGRNRSTRSRWTMNPRFGDALDHVMVGRGWTCMRDKTQEIFNLVHPDKVRHARETS